MNMNSIDLLPAVSEPSVCGLVGTMKGQEHITMSLNDFARDIAGVNLKLEDKQGKIAKISLLGHQDDYERFLDNADQAHECYKLGKNYLPVPGDICCYLPIKFPHRVKMLVPGNPSLGYRISSSHYLLDEINALKNHLTHTDDQRILMELHNCANGSLLSNLPLFVFLLK